VGALEKVFPAPKVGGVGPCSHLGCDPEAAASRWYALYVRSRHERVVENALRGKGYAAFSPFYRIKRKKVDRTTEVDVPLFPGYVFCRFDANKRLPVLVTPGIVEIVPANKPEPVDEVEITSIRTLALSGFPVQPWPFLRSGQRIRLEDGPLCGTEGTFVRVKDEYHLVVSVTLLQRAVSVVVDRDAALPLFANERPMQLSRVHRHGPQSQLTPLSNFCY